MSKIFCCYLLVFLNPENQTATKLPRGVDDINPLILHMADFPFMDALYLSYQINLCPHGIWDWRISVAAQLPLEQFTFVALVVKHEGEFLSV